MIFPLGKVVVDENADPSTIYLIGMRYKTVPVGIGEPPRFEESIDWDATAKASAVITNIGGGEINDR